MASDFDAPCSGTGVIKQNPDIKLNRTELNIKELNDIQLKLLNNLAKYVKVDGNLYYSTCSILKDENDKIIEKFLKNNSNFVCEKVESKLNSLKTEYGLTFLPNLSVSAGFYFSKLKKVVK